MECQRKQSRRTTWHAWRVSERSNVCRHTTLTTSADLDIVDTIQREVWHSRTCATRWLYVRSPTTNRVATRTSQCGRSQGKISLQPEC